MRMLFRRYMELHDKKPHKWSKSIRYVKKSVNKSLFFKKYAYYLQFNQFFM